MQPTLSVLDNFYAGFSMSHLNQGTITYNWGNNTLKYPMKMHYYFMTGAEYRISNTLAIDPNIFVKTDIAKWSTDFNAMLVYNEKFRGGLTYRTSNEIAIVLGFKFTPDLQIGYSYDLTLNTLRSYNDGTHEILIKYCFMPKMKPKPEKIPIPRLTPRFL
jgi:type IX secretion system PorP/SprF family membrane protein